MTLSIKPSTKAKMCIELTTPNKAFTLMADDKSDYDSWVAAVESSILAAISAYRDSEEPSTNVDSIKSKNLVILKV